MTDFHLPDKNSYGNIPRANAPPLLAATFASSRNSKYFGAISLATFSLEATRYAGTKCFSASTEAHWLHKSQSMIKHTLKFKTESRRCWKLSKEEKQ